MMTTEIDSQARTVFDLFAMDHYLEVMRARMGIDEGSRRSGVIKEVSEILKVHSTFLSQILNEKSHLSLEQAMRFADWSKFNPEETDYFLLLVQRARAGTKTLEEYFHSKIETIRISRMTLASRIRVKNTLSFEDQARYYETWVTQAIHFLVQIPKYNSQAKIAAALQLTRAQVDRSVKLLLELGILRATAQGFKVEVEFIHLERSSPFYPRVLSGWRLKVVEDLARGLDPDGIHYSSVVTLSAKDVEAVKKAILKCIEDTRTVIGTSASEEMYAYHVDFYGLELKP